MMNEFKNPTTIAKAMYVGSEMQSFDTGIVHAFTYKHPVVTFYTAYAGGLAETRVTDPAFDVAEVIQQLC